MVEIVRLSEPLPVSMSNDWYDMATQDHFWIQWRFRSFQRLYGAYLKPGMKLLEIGCGNGVVRDQVEKAYDVTVDATDLNMFALEKAGKGRGRLLTYNVFDRHPDMVGAYDAVLLMDVIEHIDNDQAFLEACLDHLKPGGRVLINVPAFQWLYSRYDKEDGHVRRYNKNEISALFKRTGLSGASFSYWGFTALPVILARKGVLLFMKDRFVVAGFQPPGMMADVFLRFLMWIDLHLLRWCWRIGGSSLMATGISK
ncbi:MAG: class I SAM-dependent methyltransferase [Flavobacteriales bacterium]|nr:class I SAM-dependent methyltransferase [Flavobacteriales bacterium]